MPMASTSTQPPVESGPNGQNPTPPTSNKPEDSSSLEITYSTISPKVENASAYPMQIKLNLIDQNPRKSNLTNSNGDVASCESPFPMTPSTPGGSGNDLSKKQRHNLREQRRILRISNQFDILRNKLESAGYSSSKKDKYSVLQATLEYINYLEKNQQPNGPPPVTNSIPPTSGLSITAPPATTSLDKNGHSFMIDSMPSPVPALSVPMHQFPLEMDSSMFGSGNGSATPSFAHVECIEGSMASYKDVFVDSSMPSLLCKLDGTIVEANSLFLELSCKTIDELRLHSLYTLCTPMETHKMHSLVSKVQNFEMASAQSKMQWHFSTTGDRKVFVSVSMIHDSMHRPANLHCSILPLS